MAGPFRPSRVLEELVNSALSGELDEARCRQLESMLREDRDALRWYRDMASLHIDLRTLTTAKRVNRRALAQIESIAHGSPDRIADGVSPRTIPPVSRSHTREFFRRVTRPLRRYRGDPRFTLATVWVLSLLFAAGAAGVIAALATMFRGGSAPGNQQIADQRPIQPSEPARPVARLNRAFDCVWSSETGSPSVGDDLMAGRNLVLKSGLAEVVFESGAQAILQGPASLVVRSRNSAALNHGRVTVTVGSPAGRGFEIDTLGMRYTDLGTEFGVLVTQTGEQEAHVFRGKVQAEEAGSLEQRAGSSNPQLPAPRSLPPASNSPLAAPCSLLLSAHEAIRIAALDGEGKPSKPIERIAADENQFVRNDRLALIAAQQLPPFRRWKQYRDELCKRPDLIAYYDFQSDDADRTILRNRAVGGSQYDAKITGAAQWGEGRFPGKQAIEFAEGKGGARAKFSGGLPEATFAAWVQLSDFRDLDNRGYLRDLLGNDKWSTQPGAVHWRLAPPGALSIAINRMTVNPKSRWAIDANDSQSLYSASGPMGWHLLATTFSFPAGKLAHYFDGHEVGAAAIRGREAILGEVTIGNNNDPHQRSTPCGLRGRMDELIILRTALSPEAVKQIYDATAATGN